MEIKNTLFISLGSNLGERKEFIEKAYQAIENTIGPIVQKSSFYENEAVGFVTDDLFLNTCIEVSTSLEPIPVLTQLQEIEKEIGRTQKSTDGGYQSRCIDLDIIFFNDSILDTKTLKIPHPEFRNRDFVLIPLLEIAKNKIDPITQLSVNQLHKL